MAKTNEFSFLQNNLEEIHNQSAQKGFLGREFLTWIWFFAENVEGSFEFESDHGSKHQARLWLDDRIVLTSKTGRAHEHIIKGGAPSTSDEAAISLRSGKAVKELKIALDVEGVGLYAATLGGEDLSAKSIKLPDPQDQSDQTVLEQRIEYLGLFTRAMDTLFAKFMDERTDKNWDTKHLSTIRNWIQTRSQNAKVIH